MPLLPVDYDFVADRTVCGKQLRWLTLVDEYTKECLALHVAASVTGEAVRGVQQPERGRDDLGSRVQAEESAHAQPTRSMTTDLTIGRTLRSGHFGRERHGGNLRRFGRAPSPDRTTAPVVTGFYLGNLTPIWALRSAICSDRAAPFAVGKS